jgi:hypothetical protein
MRRNDYYNLHSFFRNHRVAGFIIAILYIPIYPFITILLSVILYTIQLTKELFVELPETYKILFDYIKYCIDEKVGD